MNEQKQSSSLMDQKDFWDSLQTDILTSGQNPTTEDFQTITERSFMFSLFFRGCAPLEMHYYQRLFDIKDYGYIVLFDLYAQNNINIANAISDEFFFHRSIKNFLHNTHNTVGPLIVNRLAILISVDTYLSEEDHIKESINISNKIRNFLKNKFNLDSKVCIGTLQGIHSIYTSYINTLSCRTHNIHDDVIHYLNKRIVAVDSNSIDFLNTEQYLFNAVRMHKQEAYNYYGVLMDWIRPLDDDLKRNKIFEILTLITFAMRLDEQTTTRFIDYSTYIKQFMALRGDDIIESAFQRFVYITNYFKTQSTIDYSNHIVKATKDYLEAHYTEDISLEDMAAQVNISPQYFSKLIKKTTGFNFIDWLSMLRVKKAKELLVNSNFTVKEICFMVGYKDPNYFSRIFKKRIGLTPSEFVKTHMSQQ